MRVGSQGEQKQLQAIGATPDPWICVPPQTVGTPLIYMVHLFVWEASQSLSNPKRADGRVCAQFSGFLGSLQPQRFLVS